MAHLMWDSINKELKESNITEVNQPGCMENRLCQTDSISFFDPITYLVGKRNSADVIICKALDFTPCGILIKKLEL